MANLSDALFAIAMTLLVLSLEVPPVPPEELAAALADEAPQLVAFVISFAVVAHFWWVHHRFFAVLGFVEPGLVALNLVLLSAVALLPFPTALIGRDPTARSAVLPYLVLIALIAILHLLLLVRARTRAAWRAPLPPGLFPWLLAGWGASAAVTLLAVVAAIWMPLLGLGLLLATWPVEALVVRWAPAAYAEFG